LNEFAPTCCEQAGAIEAGESAHPLQTTRITTMRFDIKISAVAAPRQRITCPASHPNLRDVRGELRCYR
jgi:hypothetical protein